MVEIERRIADRGAAPIEEAGAAIVVGVTIGSVLAQADDTTSTLLARADGLMYAAKRGR